MDNENPALAAASRLNDIPFVDFTKGLVVDIFDALVETHITQMQEYASFVTVISNGLSAYINNTIDNVSFADISTFISSYNLPQPPLFPLKDALSALEKPAAGTKPELPSTSGGSVADSTKWWGGLMNTLGPLVSKLVDKVKDTNLETSLKAIDNFNNDVKDISTMAAAKMPTYEQIHKSIAALIASNKYALLQNVVNEGKMQLKIRRGKIETRLSFNTWAYDSHSDYSSTTTNTKDKSASNTFRGGGLLGFLSGRRSFNRDVNKVTTVSVNTASNSSSSGTNINIFGGVVLEFETA
jgi:hypothetical protein